MKVVSHLDSVLDPITGDSAFVRTTIDYDSIDNYRVIENRVFNPLTGITEIKLKGIAPCDDARALFWSRYADLVPLFHRMEQYNPGHTFPLSLWRSFFR